MGFTTPVFILKNTPELRDKLVRLGYKIGYERDVYKRQAIAMLISSEVSFDLQLIFTLPPALKMCIRDSLWFMKIKLERLIMRNDIIFKRSVQFRDENKNSWTVDFEDVYKRQDYICYFHASC